MRVCPPTNHRQFSYFLIKRKCIVPPASRVGSVGTLMPRLRIFLIVAAAVSACATTPDVSYSYYPVRATGIVSVTQTVDCNSSKTDLVILYSPALTTSYAADTAQEPYTLVVSKLDSPFADTDFGFNLYDDGRLKSINASTTGQGEATAKAAVSLATTAQALGGGAPAAMPGPLTVCAVIAERGKGRPLTLTYTKTIDYAHFSPNVPVNLDPVSASLAAYNALKPGLPLLQVMMNTPVPNRSGARYAENSGHLGSGYVPLTLQEIDNAQIDVLAQGQPIYSGAVAIPSSRAYELPIPKAMLFGKQGFSLTLSEAGVVTSIDYNKTSGGAGALNVVSGAAGASQASVAARATETLAQADLIAQQQRLANCQADPSDCK